MNISVPTTVATAVFSLTALMFVASTAAEAKSCTELRSLCWTMRSDKNDCTAPYRRCQQTGTFITPLGRVFKATSKQ